MDEQTHETIRAIESALLETGVLEFSGEAQLLEWSKSTSRDGPKVKFLLPDDDSMAPFESATIRKGKQAGQLYHVFAIRIDENVVLEEGRAVAVGQATAIDKNAADPKGLGVVSADNELKGGALARLSGMWCQNPLFHKWLSDQTGYNVETPEQARVQLLIMVDARSRREIDHDQIVAANFERFIRAPFMQYMQEHEQ